MSRSKPGRSKSSQSKGSRSKGGQSKGGQSKGGQSKSSRSKGGQSKGGQSKSSRSGEQSGQRSPGSRSGGPRRRADNRGLGGDHVEGRQAVRELLLAGSRRVREILIVDDLDPADILDDIAELANEMKVSMRPLTRRKFEAEALTESHQGVLARAQPLKEFELDELALRPDAFLIVLDGVTDPGNLGAILRTAECAGVTGVVLPRHRAVHISPTVTKTAAGAIEHLPMAVAGGVPTAISRLSDLGVYTVGLDGSGERSIFDAPLADGRPVALVLGAEGRGLGRLVKQRVNDVVAIPLVGHLNSLNVAMAGAVACFEVVRQRGPAS